MSNEQYLHMIHYVEARPALKTVVVWSNHIITGLTYLIYLGYLLVALLKYQSDLYKIILVPGISFVLFSLIRSKLNYPRPYEVLNFKPFIKKETKGKSFPSRHVFCIFLIGVTFLQYEPYGTGILFLVFGMILAISRVLVGVHFLKDVLAGALIGIVCGLLTFL